MKNFIKTACALLFLILSVSPAQAANYKYSELMIKDYDEMLAMVQNFSHKAQAALAEENQSRDQEAIEQLREAMKLILSRPDSDNMVSKLMPEIRKDLVNLSAFESSLAGIANEALETLKNSKAATSVQCTSLFIVENILAQIRPELRNKPEMRRIAEAVRDAKIKVSEDVIKERKVRGMFKTQSPSEAAALMLKGLSPQKPKK